METTAQKLRALALSIGVHLACVLVVAIGLFWTRTDAPLSIAGSPIEATLVSAPPANWEPAATRAPVNPAPAAPKPQPKPVPAPQKAEEEPQPAPQAPIRQPDTRDTERAALLAQQAEEKAKAEEQERRRQEQVLLDEQKQRDAERRERLRQQELAREQELAEIRKQREEAEKRRKLEAEKLKQIADLKAQTPQQTPAPATPAPPADRLGNNGRDDSLAGRYALAIQQAVTQAWLRPENVASVQCRVRIIQIPGGEVISASILSPCPTDELTKRSMEAAVLKAQPLPYRGYESVFSRQIDFTFCYPRDRCQ